MPNYFQANLDKFGKNRFFPNGPPSRADKTQKFDFLSFVQKLLELVRHTLTKSL
jgi:hypothetical protein